MRKISKNIDDNSSLKFPDAEEIIFKKKEEIKKFEAMCQVVAGIAHDINNLLTTLSGYAEMLEEDMPVNSPLSEKTGKIQEAVLKARSLTDQLFTLNRQDEHEKFHVKISEVLCEAIRFVKSSIPPDIKFRSRITESSATVLADPTQLFRVFLNLLTNAIQSMEKEGGTLSVSLKITKGSKLQQKLKKDIVSDDYVTVTISDTGTGIDDSLKSRIFQPYFTTNKAGKGKGLGLSVVHDLVSEMEGEILVSGKKAAGSVFYVFLPVSTDYTRNTQDLP